MEGTNNPQSKPVEPEESGTPTPISNDSIPPAPGTIPKSTIKINEVLEANKESNGEPIRTVRTFQSDIAGSVKNDNVSMIKIALAEKTRREQSPQYSDISRPRKSHKVLIISLIVILLLGAGLAAFYFYINKPLPPTIAETIAPNEPELMYSEEQSMVSTHNRTTDQIISELRSEMLENLDLGVIKRILLSTGSATSTRNTTSSEFLNIIRSRASDSLKAAFDNQYFLGGYSGNPHDTFILIKVNSYESAYPGMLAWEPYMDSDIGRFFPSSLIATSSQPSATTTATSTQTIVSSSTASTSDITIASSSSPETSLPIRTVNQTRATFVDKIIHNKDTRSLVDLDGKIKFLYTFLDSNTLLIVSSERGLKEVQARLTTGRIRR